MLRHPPITEGCSGCCQSSHTPLGFCWLGSLPWIQLVPSRFLLHLDASSDFQRFLNQFHSLPTVSHCRISAPCLGAPAAPQYLPTAEVFLRHVLPRSCHTVSQFLSPEVLGFFGSWIEAALTNNRTEGSTQTPPVLLLSPTPISWAPKTPGNKLCTHLFLPLPSSAGWQIWQIPRCNPPLPERALPNQCPVHKRGRRTLKKFKSLTYIHLTCTTERGLLLL